MNHQQHQSNTFQRCLWRQRWTKIIKPLWIVDKSQVGNFQKSSFEATGNQSLYAVWLNDCVRSQQRIVEFDQKMTFADAEECMDLVNQLISLGLIADEIFFSMIFCKLRSYGVFFFCFFYWPGTSATRVFWPVFFWTKFRTEGALFCWSATTKKLVKRARGEKQHQAF